MKMVFLFAVSVLALATGANAAPAPRIYLATAPDHLLVIEIYQKPDGKLVGEVETLQVGMTGLVQENAFPVEGTMTGDQVSLKPKLEGFGDAYSGMVDGQTLRVVSRGTPATLVTANLASVAKARGDIEVAAEKVDAAWVETQPKLGYDKLSKTGASLDTALPAMLTGVTSGAGIMVDGVQTAQGMRSRYVTALKQKLATAVNGDKAGIEDDIQTFETGWYSEEGDLIMGEGSTAQAFTMAQAMLVYFRTACADAARTNAQTPPQCGKVADYETALQTSQAEVRARFVVAEQMFETSE